MQPTQLSPLPSLQQFCYKVIVDDCNQKNICIDLDKTIQEKVTPELFLKLKNLQDKCVNLTVYSWTNHEFCLYKHETYSLYSKFASLKNTLQKKTDFIFKSILVDDRKWNAKFGSPMWETVDDHNKCLNDYGFNPGEEITIFFEIGGIHFSC